MSTGDSSWWQNIEGVKLTAHPRLLMGVRIEYSYLPIFIYGLRVLPVAQAMWHHTVWWAVSYEMEIKWTEAAAVYDITLSLSWSNRGTRRNTSAGLKSGTFQT